eukprot:gb/GFBE01019796.1/.p1 GENE.gb/GFBE01019796.1/~~gb/GFBE01019796.1/.p1  ORF type:complete len:401 (+),score=153.03 gb/GFBE01019796.1/:1-1203(+)
MASMATFLKFLCLLGVARAIRQEGQMEAEALSELEAEAEAEVEVEGAPGRLYAELRRAKNLASQAEKLAATHEETTKAAAAAADDQEDKANMEAQKQAEASKMAETEVEKKLSATKKHEDAVKTHDEANKAWQKALAEMKKAQEASLKATKAYTDRKAEIEKIRANLAKEEQKLMDKAEAAKNLLDKKTLVQQTLQDKALAVGAAKTQTVAALENQRAVVQSAQEKLNAQIVKAQDASTKAQELRAAATAADSKYHEAVSSHQAKKACRGLIESVINSVTTFYDNVDILYDDLTARYDQAEEQGDTNYKPWEQIKSHKELKPVLSKYNSVVLAYKTLGAQCPDIYKKVVGTIAEVKTNSQEQIRAVCDPADQLKEMADSSQVVKHCGAGLWSSVGLEEQP